MASYQEQCFCSTPINLIVKMTSRYGRVRLCATTASRWDSFGFATGLIHSMLSAEAVAIQHKSRTEKLGIGKIYLRPINCPSASEFNPDPSEIHQS